MQLLDHLQRQGAISAQDLTDASTVADDPGQCFPTLIDALADAVWAIRFYQQHGFQLVSAEEKNRLLKKYWAIPERQIETSVVLADARWREIHAQGSTPYSVPCFHQKSLCHGLTTRSAGATLTPDAGFGCLRQPALPPLSPELWLGPVWSRPPSFPAPFFACFCRRAGTPSRAILAPRLFSPQTPRHLRPKPPWRLTKPLKIALEITPNLEPLFGTRDENLSLMEDALGVRIDLRSDAVHVEGSAPGVARVRQIFEDFEALRRQGVNPHNGELNGMLKLVVTDPATTLRSLADSGKQRSAGVKRIVQPRSVNQRKYIEAIEQNDMTFGVGPAGTGKTYLAVAMAAAAWNAKKVSRIILVRPAVEAGERLGFLPGSLQEKVDPYLRPLYDALYDLLDPEKVDKMLEKNIIEVAPLAFMRGRTLNDAFIIMDEAQNTTIEQMKMFLTRLGANSKAVITGDITQIDLPNPRKSGLVDAINVLDGVEGIHFCHFEDCDVVRHTLVQRIVRAYESVKSQQQELPLSLGEAIEVGTHSHESNPPALAVKLQKPQ
jgi:phosphate starvation-inducible PhoH-like protein